MLINLGEQFKRARKEKGLSQKELSEKLQISYSYYSNIERGIKTPSFDVFCSIVKVLEIPSIMLGDCIIYGKDAAGTSGSFIEKELNLLTTEQNQFIYDVIFTMIENFKKMQ